MLDDTMGKATFAGYLMFSGVFPNAKIQQIAVAEGHRRRGVGSALLRETISRREAEGCLRVTAAVAGNLPGAHAFYERNGFGAVLERPGGKARKRTITVRARDLDNEHLLSAIDRPRDGHPLSSDLGLRLRGAGVAPLYAIDLNVLFDAIKMDRRRAPLAQRLMGAALSHRFRLATTSEFKVELARGLVQGADDPAFALALQLPRLPAVDAVEETKLAAIMHGIVFADTPPSEARRVQALSDARHLAHSALARASGFVTSDGRMLSARSRLMEAVGIDVISLEDFDGLLDDTPAEGDLTSGFASKELVRVPASRDEAVTYFQGNFDGKALADGLADPIVGTIIEAMKDAGRIVGISVRSRAAAIDAPIRSLVHVRQDHVKAQLLAESLLHSQCRQACIDGPAAIEATIIAGQSATRRAAILQGFVPRGSSKLVKVAIGRPVTPKNWTTLARFTHRRTGLRLQEALPATAWERREIMVYRPDGTEAVIGLAALEDSLGPTILAWPGRTGAVVPIARTYADALLGTSPQASMFGPSTAALGDRRTYLSSPKAAHALRPATPILSTNLSGRAVAAPSSRRPGSSTRS